MNISSFLGPRYEPLVVAPSIKNANDDDLVRKNLEQDRRTALEAYGAKTGVQIVATRAPVGKGLQSHARGFDPIDVGACMLLTRAISNKVVERNEVCFRCWAEGDLVLHLALLNLAC